MNKPGFNLQNVQFSDSDEQSPPHLSSNMIQNYNREYSIIYQQIQSFLKECKQNIFKFISINQYYSVGFNVMNIFSQLCKIQTSMLVGVSDGEKQQLQNKKNVKVKYQKQFQNIILRMGEVIQDFLNFQIHFKKQYSGCTFQTNNVVQNNPKQQKRSASKMKMKIISPSLSIRKMKSQITVKSGGSSTRQKINTLYDMDDEKQQKVQQKLREILHRKFTQQKQQPIKFCDIHTDPYKNILRLQQKIDIMQSEVILNRTRQQKIIQIFNNKRINNLKYKKKNLIPTSDNQIQNNQDCQNVSEACYSLKGKNNYYTHQNIEQNKKKNLKFNHDNLQLDIQAINVSNNKYSNQPTSSSTFNGQYISPSSNHKKIISPTFSQNKFIKSPKNAMMLNRLMNQKSPGHFKKKKIQHDGHDEQISKSNSNKYFEGQKQKVKITSYDKNEEEKQTVQYFSSNNRQEFMKARAAYQSPNNIIEKYKE